MDALLNGALAVLLGAIALTGVAVVAIRVIAQRNLDDAVTEIGAATTLVSGESTAPAAEALNVVVVPMRRRFDAKRDAEQFIQDAAHAQAAAERSLRPEQRQHVETVQRVRALRARERRARDGEGDDRG